MKVNKFHTLLLYYIERGSNKEKIFTCLSPYFTG